MNIPFVIPVYNRLAYTKDCLHLLKNYQDSSFFTKNNVPIIIVDDGSTDGTGDWIRENYPEVIVLKGDGNLWYSGGVNEGMKYAMEELAPDFIMIWENDADPSDDYFDQLQEIIESWDGDSVICSKIYYKSRPDVILAMGGYFNSRNGKKGLNRYKEEDRPEYEANLEVDWFSGHGFIIHKTIIEKVGYLDAENFPQYHSDADYGLRIKKAGFRNVIYFKLKLYHDTATTGVTHKKDKSVKEFIDSLSSLRSRLNIRRNLKFYKIHTTGSLAYMALLRTYMIYTGSFLKWKFLGWFGIEKKEDGFY